MAPAAADDMRVAELRVGPEKGGRSLFFAGEQILAALDFSGRQSNHLSHNSSSSMSAPRAVSMTAPVCFDRARATDRVLNPLGDTRLRMEAVANARGLRGGSRFVRACRDRQV